MKLITRHTDYAVQALCYLAAQDDGATVTELCAALDMPRAFLRGILQRLSTHGCLHSTKGRGGGFRLARAPSRILLVDVIRVFQGPFELYRCLSRKRPCPRMGICALRRELAEVEMLVKQRLGQVSIQTLVQADERNSVKTRKRPRSKRVGPAYHNF